MKPKSSTLTVERLRELVCYDADAGTFVWRPRLGKGGQLVSKPAGHTHAGHGYITITVDGQSYLAHRLAWFYVYGNWPAYYIDHRNGDTADNRIENLREATQSQNVANQHRLRSNNTSGHRGVYFRKDSGRWRAMIGEGGRDAKRIVQLGTFNTKEEAKAAYDAALVARHGEFANTTPH